MKKTLGTLALSATLALSSFGDNVKQFVVYEDTILNEMKASVTRKKVDELFGMLETMHTSSMEFNKNVTNHIESHIIDWVKEDSQQVGMILGQVAFHLKRKIDDYKTMKTPFKRVHPMARKKLDELIATSKEMETKIQSFIETAQMGIQAKQYIRTVMMQKDETLSVKDYWYDTSIEGARTLFVVLNGIDYEDIDSIYVAEDRLNEELLAMQKVQEQIGQIELPKVIQYDFNFMNKPLISRVSIV